MAERFQKFGPVLQRLRLRRETRPKAPSQVTAIDLEGATLRIVQTSGRGVVSRVLNGTLEFPADADRNDPAVLGPALQRALNRLGVRPASVVMGVPRARVILRTLTVPVIEKQAELASLVCLQVGRDLPFRLDEAVVDFKVRRKLPAAPESVPSREDGEVPAGAASTAAPAAAAAPVSTVPQPKLEVLVAVVKRDVVDFYQRLAEAAGFKLSALGLLSYANARCVDACHVADGDAAFALVSLRPEEVCIDIIASQSLLFSRGMALRTTAESSQGDATVTASVIEVVRSLHSYSGLAADPPVAKVVVAGSTGLEAKVVSALGTRLATPCTVLDLGTALQLPEDSRAGAGGAMAPLGLALGLGDPSGLPFDFLNPKKPAEPRDLRRIAILSGIAAAAFLIVSVLGLRTMLVNRRAAVLAQVNAEAAEAEKKRPVYRKLILQAGVVEDWIRGDRDWLEHYAYLTSVLPPSEEIYLSSITVSGTNAVRLAVQARSGETLARLEKQLVAAGYEVKPMAITPGSDRFGYDFRSTVEVSIPARLKVNLHAVKPAPRPIDDVSLDVSAWRKGAR